VPRNETALQLVDATANRSQSADSPQTPHAVTLMFMATKGGAA
jgi:hypothetical protein